MPSPIGPYNNKLISILLKQVLFFGVLVIGIVGGGARRARAMEQPP